MAALPALVRHPAVFRVETPIRTVAATTSEGVAPTNVQAWQAANPNLKGDGVKIGIIDTGFRGYVDRQNQQPPELPPGLDATSCQQQTIGSADPNEDDHGTAVAEVIYDIAPNAQLYLVKATALPEQQTAVECLANAGVKVINFSQQAFDYQGPGDGTYPAAPARSLLRIVDQAVALGIFWASAAGNYAQNQWSGDWRETVGPNGKSYVEFGAGGGNFLRYSLGGRDASGQANQYPFELRWSEPGPRWGGACIDFNMYLSTQPSFEPRYVLASGQAIAPQDCDASETPHESMAVPVPVAGDYYLFIERKHGDPNNPAFVPRLDVRSNPGPADPAKRIPAGSLAHPADSRSTGMVAVGAVTGANWGTLDPTSGRGATSDGRPKPDLVAPSGVSTASRGAQGFGQTSAATPHVAGAAALVLQANPTFSTSAIRQYLLDRAVEAQPGRQNELGKGRVCLGAPPTTPTGYAAAVMADQPIGYWRLGDGCGAADDLSNNRLDGQMIGSLTRQAPGLVSASADDSALQFTGTGGRVEVANDLKLQTPGAVTVEAWFRVPGPGQSAYSMIASKRGTYGYALFFENAAVGGDGQLVWEVRGVGTVSVRPRLQANTTYYVVGTASYGGLHLYVNGGEVGSAPGGSFNAGERPLYLGFDPLDGLWPLVGTLDDVAVYGTALPAERVRAHYAAGTGCSLSAASSPYSQAVIADTPIGYWRLGDQPCSWAATDASGRGNHGGRSGSVGASQPSLLAAEPSNSAMVLDGSVSSRVHVPNSPTLQNATAATVEAWVRIDGAGPGTWSMIASKRGTNGYALFFENAAIGGAGLLTWEVRGVGSLQVRPNFAEGSVYHIVGTADSAGMRLFVNGGEVASGTGGTVNAGTQPLYLGFDPADGNWPLKGALEEVAVYDYALGADRVRAHYSAGSGCVLGSGSSTYSQTVIGQGPAGYWRLGDPDCTWAATDASPSGGNHGGRTNRVLTALAEGIQNGAGTDPALALSGGSVYVPPRPSLDLGAANQNFSVELWMHPTQSVTGGLSGLIRKGTGDSDRQVAIWLTAGNRIEYQVRTTTSLYEGGVSASAVPINAWTHVALVRQGAQLSLYIDGWLNESRSIGTGATTTGGAGPLYIGSDPYQGAFAGRLDEVAVYTRALTAEEVAGHRGGGPPRDPAATYTLFSATPSAAQWSGAGEFGVRFQSQVRGVVTAVRYYKQANWSGSRSVNLWGPTGELLASADSSAEPAAAGWVMVPLAQPVEIQAGVVYTASYYTTGPFAYNEGYFGVSRYGGPLTAPTAAGRSRSGASGYPTSWYNDQTYWADVVFDIIE